MEIKEIFKKFGIELNENQIWQFEEYHKFLVSENEKYNLTAITEKEEVYVKHFLDSALGEKFIDKNALVVDIGSGAGFPAIPLKIVRPDLKFVLVDSLNKRVNFLNMLIEKLKLKDVVAVHARAEDYIKDKRESFDYAIARAVAPLNTLLEYLSPYVKVGGKCLIYKAQKLEEEIRQSKNALSILNLKIEKVESFKIEEIDAERKILLVEKISKTPPKYPRGKNLPKLKPL